MIKTLAFIAFASCSLCSAKTPMHWEKHHKFFNGRDESDGYYVFVVGYGDDDKIAWRINLEDGTIWKLYSDDQTLYGEFHSEEAAERYVEEGKAK